ncbi:MAG: VOC family protein [Leptospiraceae bacterium]|nr:VOC family protein [Leptospiraceae bacterium]MCP5493841.1 VOC family protein [Leptospiraceae bacterium]
MNSIGYFEIQASDPERAIDFYSSLFGWKFEKADGTPLPYWRIFNAGINGGLLKRPQKTPPLEFGTNSFVCSIEVEDFDKVSDLIVSYGGKIALPKFPIPGKCWQGYFIDPENNTFGIFEVDENL